MKLLKIGTEYPTNTKRPDHSRVKGDVSDLNIKSKADCSESSGI